MQVLDRWPCSQGPLSTLHHDHGRSATISSHSYALHTRKELDAVRRRGGDAGANDKKEKDYDHSGNRRTGGRARRFLDIADDDDAGDYHLDPDYGCEASSRPHPSQYCRSPFSNPQSALPSHRCRSVVSIRLSMVMLLLLAVALQPCSAAQVAFENCLPSTYTGNTPALLQWVPEYVDATLRVLDEKQNLKVTMWGNVNGSRSGGQLPPWNDTAYWNDDGKTDGKIQKSADPDKRVITTLHTKIDVLTYEPWNGDFDFCANLSRNHHCPLGPVFNATSRDQLPSVFMENNFTTSYAFTSWSATFLIKYTDTSVLNIGCVSATITPDLGGLAPLIKFLPLGILGFVGFATIFAATLSPWGTTDIFRWTSNYGRDNDLLRLVTPGFGDCLQYIQFATLTGGLTLNYPGFYQPIVSQLSWSALMFNESFVSKDPGYQSVQDGIYVTNATFGLQRLAQLTGMGNVADVWAGMIIWLFVIIAAVIAGGQLGFGARWVYRKVRNIAEEDLRAKNLPFTVGNVVRIVFNYFLLPIVALSTFQLVVYASSPAYTVGLAVLTLFLIVGFAAWLLYLIITIKPRAFLFDDLPTLLLYGPLYNTYSDEAAPFTLVPLCLTFLRGIAIGVVQASGIAQIIILAICEVVHLITIHSIRPFQSPTSMNAYHTIFTSFRLASVMLMVAFIPALGITEGPRGWIGYAILTIHACVVGFGFFLNALQTTLEVSARLSGAGGDSVRGLTRGGLSKIFGMRQLQRREGPSRNSQLSNAAMLDQEEASKAGYTMPSGRLRSESAGSGALLSRGQRSSSALDNYSIDAAFMQGRQVDGASSFTPTTPGEASTFSFLPSPAGQTRHPLAPAPALEAAADPYYRPPRKRGATMTQGNMTPPRERNRGSWASGEWSQRRPSPAAGGPSVDPADADGQISRGPTPAPGNYSQPTISFAPRTDYSTREVDFYYGVRGQRLNSDAPSRKLGTGPADPTSPMASAAGWFRSILGGKTKEKGKGFEVVRSSRMPPAMKARGGDITDDAAPQGIPVAMSMLRNGPIESDEEDETQRKKARTAHSQAEPGGTQLLDENGNPKVDSADDLEIPKIPDEPPLLPGIESAGSIRLPSRVQSRASRAGRHPPPPPLDFSLIDEKGTMNPPAIPRKSSRRDSVGAELSLHSRESSQDALNRLLAGPATATAVPEQDRNRLGPFASAMPSRLPFERNNSQKRNSSASSLEAATEELSNVELQGESSAASQDERTTSYGYVSQGNVNRIDPDEPGQLDLVGSSAEVVDLRQ